MNTDMSVDQAKGFLAGLPEETKPAATTPTAGAGAGRFDQAMADGNPNLSGNDDCEGEAENDDGTGQAGANALLSARAAATGFGRKTK